MTIGHGQSLHCSFMGNSLSSLREALKSMAEMSYHVQMIQLSYNCVHTIHQLKFLIISHELNPGEQFGSLSVTFPICVIFINVCVSS